MHPHVPYRRAVVRNLWFLAHDVLCMWVEAWVSFDRFKTHWWTWKKMSAAEEFRHRLDVAHRWKHHAMLLTPMQAIRNETMERLCRQIRRHEILDWCGDEGTRFADHRATRWSQKIYLQGARWPHLRMDARISRGLMGSCMEASVDNIWTWRSRNT